MGEVVLISKLLLSSHLADVLPQIFIRDTPLFSTMATNDQDEITIRNVANARRRLDAFDERIRIEREQSAKAHGFSNYKEYEAFQWQEREEHAAQYEIHIAEECKRLGKTVDEYWAEHPQRWIAPEWPDCNCEGAY